MRPRSALRHVLLCALLVAAAVLVSGAAPAAAATPWSGSWRGQPTHVAPLPAELRLAGAGPAWRLHYLSTSWNERPTLVRGTLTLPPGRAPAGGWPVVSFGPGQSGLAGRCAPSRVPHPPWAGALLERLLAAGYAVAVTDYEGIGMPGENPFVHGRSGAYGMIDIVRAARRIAPVSRSWAAVGYSQGGHAALFAGALAESYAPGLRHTGTVALAPLTQLRELFSLPGADAPGAPANVSLPYLGHGFAVTHPDRFAPADWFTPAGLALIEQVPRICIEEMSAAMAGLTNGDVLLDPPAALATMIELIAPQEIPRVGYPRPVRLAHGTADASLPWPLTQLTADQLATAGSEVVFTPVPDADHFTLLPAVASQTVTWLDQLFAG